MTKYELNKRLAELLGLKGLSSNYCGSWNKLMPLALRYRITYSETSYHEEYSPEMYGYTAQSADYFHATDDELSVAIVKCLIAKLEGENE